MRSPTPLSPTPDAAGVDVRVGEILDWLAHPVSADPERELRLTQGRLATFSELGLSINQYHRILELFHSRVDFLSNWVKTQFRDSDQPLDRPLRHLAHDMDQLQDQLFEGYQRVLKDIEHRMVRNRRRDPGIVAARALKALRERLELAACVARPAPQELWSRAHSLYRLCHTDPAPSGAAAVAAADAGRIYREMLAFAAIQPERLSAMEVTGTIEYLGRFAPAVVILDQAPDAPDHRLFWADTGGDAPPVAMARRLPPAGMDIVHFSCERLGTLAAEHLRELEAGAPPEQLQLPPAAAQSAYRGLLLKLHEAWVEPPIRHLARRIHSHQVCMVVGLRALVELFSNRAEQAEQPDCASDWMVINESPSGCALVHAAGDIGGIKTGEVVGIRSKPANGWDVCIVRRVLNERAGRFEVGLQMVASDSSARAVRIAFRHASTPQDTLAGLWLLPIPALRSHDAILIPAGAAASQRFVMAADDGRIRVSQGLVVQAALRTPSVELLEFQDDPYPL